MRKKPIRTLERVPIGFLEVFGIMPGRPLQWRRAILVLPGLALARPQRPRAGAFQASDDFVTIEFVDGHDNVTDYRAAREKYSGWKKVLSAAWVSSIARATHGTSEKSPVWAMPKSTSQMRSLQ